MTWVAYDKTGSDSHPGAIQSSSDHHASYLGLLFGFTLGKVSSLPMKIEGYGWNKTLSGIGARGLL